ncbi:MAG: polyprenol monophosphomannose synthase [Deltaproteobacteria bacterium]|nr:polyprenol monophosphomannose synthase [Deltaproteobacteria bacterium]
MSPKILVLTPTYEERENLRPFVAALWRTLPAADLLVIDDGSPDGTGALADELAAADARIGVRHRPRKLGLGTAYREGFLHALAEGYDLIFQMDADRSHDPRHLPAMLRAVAHGADVVLGSRAVAGGGVVGWGLGRHVLSRGGSLYARTILGLPLRDLTTGYRAFTRRALEIIDVGSLGSNGYAFQIETAYRAWQRGLHVIEVPIVFVDRRAGRSKLGRTVLAEAVLMPWRLRWPASW